MLFRGILSPAGYSDANLPTFRCSRRGIAYFYACLFWLFCSPPPGIEPGTFQLIADCSTNGALKARKTDKLKVFMVVVVFLLHLPTYRCFSEGFCLLLGTSERLYGGLTCFSCYPQLPDLFSGAFHRNFAWFCGPRGFTVDRALFFAVALPVTRYFPKGFCSFLLLHRDFKMDLPCFSSCLRNSDYQRCLSVGFA